MENLGLDPKLIAAQILNFVVFFFIFSKFMAKPFAHYIKKQKESEQERELLTEGLRKREAAIAEEKEKMLQKAREEVNRMLAAAKEDGEKLVADARARAHTEAEEIIAKARADIEQMKKDAEKEMQQRIVDMSMVLLKKGLAEYLTEDARKYVTKYILDNSAKAVKYEA